MGVVLYGKLEIPVVGVVEDLRAFYDRDDSGMIVPRPPGELENAVKQGRYFLVRNADGGAIEAAGGLFPYEDPAALQQTPNNPYGKPAGSAYMELSDTFVPRDPFGGFHLQQLLHQLRIAHLAAFERDATATLSLLPRNDSSLKNAQAVGFKSWPSPVPGCYSSCFQCARHATASAKGRPCCCDYYILDAPGKQRALAELLKQLDVKRGTITLSRTKAAGEVDTLILSCGDVHLLSGATLRALQRAVAAP